MNYQINCFKFCGADGCDKGNISLEKAKDCRIKNHHVDINFKCETCARRFRNFDWFLIPDSMYEEYKIIREKRNNDFDEIIGYSCKYCLECIKSIDLKESYDYL